MEEKRRRGDARLRDMLVAEAGVAAPDRAGSDTDEMSACAVNDRISVEVEVPHGAGIFVVYAPVGPLPENPAAAADLLVRAMASNLCLAATGGGSLGLDARSGMLVYPTSKNPDRPTGSVSRKSLRCAAARQPNCAAA